MSLSSKPLTVGEIQQVVESLGNLVKSTLDPHSLALVINNSGEATFTRSVFKLLSEAGFTSPVAKIIVNCAKKYTNLCGEDCKYFLFVLKEIIGTLHVNVYGRDEAYLRVKFIHEIESLKKILPCIFNSIRNISDTQVTSLKSYSFAKDLRCIVQTFMLSKFSTDIAMHLSNLICEFIQSISYKSNSLKVILDYVIAHFDLFCFKVLASLSESCVIRGFIFRRKSICCNVALENTRFIIIYDMPMKSSINDVSWKISDETFVHALNEHDLYQKVFAYFKEQGIKLIITPCAGAEIFKLLCDKNCIILLDRMEKEEIEHILCCIKISPLENLNEDLKSKHIGELAHLKSLFHNNSSFLNLLCLNSLRLLNAYNIMLSAPFDALWKEYYAECLNCLKTVNLWLYSNAADYSFISQSVIEECIGKPIHQLDNINCICSQLEMRFNKSLKLNENTNNILKLQPGNGSALQNPNSVQESNQDVDITLKIPNTILKSQKDIDITPQISNHVLEPYQDIGISSQMSNFILEPYQDIGTAAEITNPVVKLHQDIGIALPPGLWELCVQISLKKVQMNQSLPCRNIMHILHFTIFKLTCEKIGIEFCKVVDLKDAYHVYFERSKEANESFLEPIVSKEIMIYSVLDLIVQLLKIDGIITK